MHNTTGAARRLIVAALGLGLAFSLTACGSDAPPTATASTAPASTAPASTAPASTAPSQGAKAITITDPWVKAVDTGKTAAFGTLVNDSDTAVQIVSATTSSSSSMGLMEMAPDGAGKMVMRMKMGGFVVKAGGTHVLKPGGDHLMLVGITSPVKPGDVVSFALAAKDGTTFTFTAPARSL